MRVPSCDVRQVRANGIIVFVPKYGIEGPVYLTEKGADEEAAWTMDEAAQALSAVDGSAKCVSCFLHSQLSIWSASSRVWCWMLLPAAERCSC